MTGRPYLLRFKAPAEYLTLNKNRHRMELHRLTREWQDAAYLAACEVLGRTPQARRRRRCDVTAYLTFDVERKRDPHNYVPTMKPIIDGLVKAGVWPDDNPDWVKTHEPELRIGLPDVVVQLDEYPPPREDPFPTAEQVELGRAGIAAARAALHGEGAS